MTTEIQNKIDSATEKLNCSRETGEKQSLKQLDTSLATLKDQKDIHKENIKYLWTQEIESRNGQSVETFLQQDIKEQLLPSKQKLDALTKTMETLSPEEQKAAVREFISNEIGSKLTVLCQNRDDVVAALQVYVNGINDVNNKYAQIPYDATKSYSEYSTGTEKRLFIDGILGPHTYKALWLALFGQDLDKTIVSRDLTYGFDRREPRIIWKDQPYIPLTLPWIDKNWHFESKKSIEIIDNPQIKNSIELLYLFYDWVAKKENISLNIDEEIIKIMSNPANYNTNTANPLDWYLKAIKSLNIKLAGSNTKLVKGCDTITKFINSPKASTDQYSAQLSILTTLENDVWAHDYVADFIASRYIQLSKEPWKTQMENIQLNPNDKDYIKQKNTIDKQRLEQWKLQQTFLTETFNQMKKNAQASNASPEDIASFCNIFWVASVENVTNQMILAKISEAMKLTESDFKNAMTNSYFKMRFLESNIRAGWSEIDSFGNYIWKNPMKALFADIKGIGYWNMSSENVDTAKFIAQMIAEEAACFAVGALTAGAGWIALKAVLYWRRALKIARLANAVSRWANTARKISKLNQIKNTLRTLNLAEKTVRAERAVTWWGKAINATTTILGVSVWWAAFYEGTNAMQNIIKGVPMFQWWDDVPEITKSIAMFWALRIVNKLVATQKIITVAWKQINANPFNKLLQIKNWDKFITKWMKIAWESLVGWWAIFAVEGVWEMIIDTDHDWTKEEFIQSVLMYMMFRWAWEVGRLRISKNKQGKPEIQKENPKYKELPAHKEPKALMENNPKHKEHINEWGKSDVKTNTEVKKNSTTEVVAEVPSRVTEINKELKPIVARLKELRKNGEYDLPEAKNLKIQRDKLTIERENILEKNSTTEVVAEVPSRVTEINKELKPIVARLKELRKNGEYDLPEAKNLKIQRDKLTIERENILEKNPTTEVVAETPSRITDINKELKPIVERLKELRKNGEYDLPEAKNLKIQRDKLTIERENLLEVQIDSSIRVSEINKELKPIVERLKELRKNGEYDLPEAKDLRIKRDKLTIEREDILSISN